MKNRFVMIVAGVVGIQGACLGQSDKINEYEDVNFVPEEDRWQVDAGISHRIYLQDRSALQNRADDVHSPDQTWEDGDSEGRGWGVNISISRGIAQINLNVSKSDLEYDLEAGPNQFHSIRADRNDVELYWHEGRTKTERGVWGSSIGVKHIGVRQKIEILEGEDHLQTVGATDWWMLAPGVFGDLRPFRNDLFLFSLRSNLLIGEVSGIAREDGYDNAYDGSINESYGDERSLAYGVQFDLTAAFRMAENLLASVSYSREYLYSFDVTEDEGMMVFPDNNDALFIENAHFWYIGLDWLF